MKLFVVLALGFFLAIAAIIVVVTVTQSDPTGGLAKLVLGGLLTVAGGFISNLLLRQRDAALASTQSRKELVGAIRVAYHDMLTNVTLIDEMLRVGHPQPEPRHLTGASYRGVEIILARELPKEVYDQLGKAYRTLPLAVHNLTLLTHRQLEQDERTAIEQVRDQFRLAATSLDDYCTEKLGLEPMTVGPAAEAAPPG